MTLNYLIFLGRAARLSFSGGRLYYAWMAFLTLIAAVGSQCFFRQLVDGLAVTGMTDPVSWGIYIANFTFLVGLAAAAVMLVIPAYIYRNKDMHDVVLIGELLAIASIIMCLLFVTVDLGRPDRALHLLPFVGEPNFPVSMLMWDVVVLNGYLLLNMHICGYLLYTKYMDRQPTFLFYVRLGYQHSYRYRISLREPGRAPLLEYGHCRAPLSRIRIYGGTWHSDHSLSDHPPLLALSHQ